MKTYFLFPHRVKAIGWCLLVPGLALGIPSLYFDYSFRFLDIGSGDFFGDGNFTNELAGLFVLVGLMLIAFSRMKQEDEFIAHMRLDSLLWAVYANSLILLVCIFAIYGGAFFTVLVYNMFTVPVIYLLRFHYLMYKSARVNASAA